MSGALIERVRLSAYLVLAALLGSVVWNLDAAWGWSAGGWLTLRSASTTRSRPASSTATRGGARLVLFHLGPRIGSARRRGDPESDRTTSPSPPGPCSSARVLPGLRPVPGDRATSFPGWANIYLSPTTLGSITMVITMGFAGGFTGGYFASGANRSGPSPAAWRACRGVRGRGRLRAQLGYLVSMLTAVLAVLAGTWLERKVRVDDAVGAVAVHGASGFLGMLWVGIFAAGYPTGLNNVESSIGGQLIGMATFLPLGFLSGWVAAFVLRKLNLLRVPASVEVEGLDLVEYGTLVSPETGVVTEQVVEPDGTLVDMAALAQSGNGRPPELERMGT